MPKIPHVILEKRTPLEGLGSFSMGKVRNQHELPEHPGMLLSETTDGVSANDIVFPWEIPDKGGVLNAMSHFWRTVVIGDLFPTDLVAAGAAIDGFLPERHRKNPSLQKRCTVIKNLKMCSGEFIARGALAGSGKKSYQKNRQICGQLLPAGLRPGDKFPYPLFTPTTKALEGHDEHVSADEAVEQFGFHVERATLKLYSLAADYAFRRGIILADTKFEMGRDELGQLILGDEVITPDSSRFWPVEGWRATREAGVEPESYDKEPLRAWMTAWYKSLGYESLDPKNPDHVKLVHELPPQEEVIAAMTRRYRYILWGLTGTTLERYQRNVLHLGVEIPKRKILVLVGSRSDLDQTTAGMDYLHNAALGELRVLSCHRNATELIEGAKGDFLKFDAIIAGAGEAAQLPGVMLALLNMNGRRDIPVLGVGFKGKSAEADMAARLSITRLPGRPVQFDEDGDAYFGPGGFFRACVAAVEHEFLPKGFGAKPAELIETF